MTDEVEVKVIPSEDPRLGRIVEHDPRSRAYAFKAPRKYTLVSKKHSRWIPILDQGYIGSCTGNTGVGVAGTSPYYTTLVPKFVSHDGLDQSAAVQLYSEATAIDQWQGTYPPDDTGSSGLAVAKVLKGRGWISGYQHTFSFEDLCYALQHGPVMFGTNWYSNFFDPSPDGELTIGTNDSVAGGHEVVMDEIDVERERIWITNSWGEHWGVNGRAWLSFDLVKRLLSEQGDIVVPVPLSQPAPEPTPSVDTETEETVDQIDAALWEAVKVWTTARKYKDNKKAQTAVKEWAAKKGLTS